MPCALPRSRGRELYPGAKGPELRPQLRHWRGREAETEIYQIMALENLLYGLRDLPLGVYRRQNDVYPRDASARGGRGQGIGECFPNLCLGTRDGPEYSTDTAG